MFFDFTSAFNTTQPSQLSVKLTEAGVNQQLPHPQTTVHDAIRRNSALPFSLNPVHIRLQTQQTHLSHPESSLTIQLLWDIAQRKQTGVPGPLLRIVD